MKLPIIVTIIIKKQTRQFREYYNLIILQTWPEYCVLVHTFTIWSMFIYHKEYIGILYSRPKAEFMNAQFR